jgi:hypothetical protein
LWTESNTPKVDGVVKGLEYQSVELVEAEEGVVVVVVVVV